VQPHLQRGFLRAGLAWNAKEEQMSEERRTGTVKWFSRVKGYGFITPEGEEKEIFVHFSGIEGDGFRNLEEGERVSFVVEETPKGPQAAQVRPLPPEGT
jgi:CspA family cold shock protein